MQHCQFVSGTNNRRGMEKLLLGASEFSLLISGKELYAEMSRWALKRLLALSELNSTVKKNQHLLIIYNGLTNKWKENQSYSAGFVTIFWFFTVAKRSAEVFVWQIFLLHPNITQWKPFPAFLLKEFITLLEVEPGL